MPTLTRTWTSSQNNAPSDQTTQEAQGQSVLLALKTAFLSAGWTVTQSCDSTAVNSSGDNWSANSDIVGGTGAHSWIVLRSPANYPSTGNYYYFAIDYNASADYRCDFHTATADWTGGTTSSIGSNSTSYSWNDEDILPTSLSDVKYHQSYSDSGDMAFVVTQNSNSNPGFGLYVNKLTNAPSADNYPILTYISGHSSSFSATSSRQNSAWDRDAFLESSTYNKMHWIDGTNGLATTQELYNSDVFTYSGGQGSGSDIDGNLPAMPLVVVTTTSSKQAFRGVVTDIFCCNRSTIYNPRESASPQSGTITLWNTEYLWIPGSSAPDFGI
jgi:hypothetical protein